MYSALAGACKDSIGAKDGKSKKEYRKITDGIRKGGNDGYSGNRKKAEFP